MHVRQQFQFTRIGVIGSARGVAMPQVELERRFLLRAGLAGFHFHGHARRLDREQTPWLLRCFGQHPGHRFGYRSLHGQRDLHVAIGKHPAGSLVELGALAADEIELCAALVKEAKLHFLEQELGSRFAGGFHFPRAQFHLRARAAVLAIHPVRAGRVDAGPEPRGRHDRIAVFHRLGAPVLHGHHGENRQDGHQQQAADSPHRSLG